MAEMSPDNFLDKTEFYEKRTMLDSTIVKVSNFALGCYIFYAISLPVIALLFIVVSLLFVM